VQIPGKSYEEVQCDSEPDCAGEGLESQHHSPRRGKWRHGERTELNGSGASTIRIRVAASRRGCLAVIV
jgi:hypothetical protein